MTTRLHVQVDEEEMAAIRLAAQLKGLSVSEWVREVLRHARQDAPVGNKRRKLAALRRAARGEYPTGDIATMLAEIQAGRLT